VIAAITAPARHAPIRAAATTPQTGKKQAAHPMQISAVAMQANRQNSRSAANHE
jgi:hypothetical protein